MCVGPGRGVATGLLDDPGAERDDDADLFGDGDEIVGRHQAARRVAPSQQRLAAGDGLGPGVDLRLVVEFEFLVRDARAADPARAGAAPECARPSRIRRSDRCCGPSDLDAIHRHIGVLQQDIRVRPVVGTDGDADADAEKGLAPVEIEGLGHRLDEPPGEARRPARASRCRPAARRIRRRRGGRACRSRAGSAANARPTCLSRRSPIEWPWASLTDLKLSRSR